MTATGPLMGDRLVAELADDTLAGALEVLLEVDPDYRPPGAVLRRLLERVAEAERGTDHDLASAERALAAAEADVASADAEVNRLTEHLVALAGELARVVHAMERELGRPLEDVRVGMAGGLLASRMAAPDALAVRMARLFPHPDRDALPGAVLAELERHRQAGPAGCTCA